MGRLFCLLGACLCYWHYATAELLEPGDIAIVGFNFSDPDEFSFITFTDLEAGAVIYFTDSGWMPEGRFRPNEGYLVYTVPEGGIQAGSVVTFTDGVSDDFTKVGVSGFFGLAMAGDQIIVFQRSFEDPHFIFALNNTSGGGWQYDVTDNNSTALPEGLVDGVTAVALDLVQNAAYNCNLPKGTKETLLPYIVNAANWEGGRSRVVLPSACHQKLPLNVKNAQISQVGDLIQVVLELFQLEHSYRYVLFRSCGEHLEELLLVDGAEGHSPTHFLFEEPISNINCCYQVIEFNGSDHRVICHRCLEQLPFDCKKVAQLQDLEKIDLASGYLQIVDMQGKIRFEGQGVYLQEFIKDLPSGIFIVRFQEKGCINSLRISADVNTRTR